MKTWHKLTALVVVWVFLGAVPAFGLWAWFMYERYRR